MEKAILEQLRVQLPEVDFDAGISSCVGDEEFYLEILNDFSELPILEELNRFMNENDAHNYCIRIHGFKNNAYTIGAKALGDLAFEMEKISKVELTEELKEKQKQLTEWYHKICLAYQNVK